MTGFGAATVQRDGLTIRVEIRSVNHRHLQAKLRLPPDFLYLESDLEALLKKRLHRGAVAVTVTLARDESKQTVNVNVDTAKRYHSVLKKLGKELRLENGIAISDLVSLPGVIGSKETAAPTEKEAKVIVKTMGDALGELLEMREQEGGSLAVELERAATAIEKTVQRIEKRMPTVVKQHHKNLRRRVSELLEGTNVPESDLAREIAMIADRLDVTEETTRLHSHLGQLRGLLGKGGAIGRQLDFLAQEFFREANTTGSKCNDAQVAHFVVDLKTHIERLREQVQNVE